MKTFRTRFWRWRRFEDVDDEMKKCHSRNQKWYECQLIDIWEVVGNGDFSDSFLRFAIIVCGNTSVLHNFWLSAFHRVGQSRLWKKGHNSWASFSVTVMSMALENMERWLIFPMSPTALHKFPGFPGTPAKGLPGAGVHVPLLIGHSTNVSISWQRCQSLCTSRRELAMYKRHTNARATSSRRSKNARSFCTVRLSGAFDLRFLGYLAMCWRNLWRC